MLKIKTYKTVVLEKLIDGCCFMYDKSYCRRIYVYNGIIKCYCFNTNEIVSLGSNYEIRPVILEIREILCPE